MQIPRVDPKNVLGLADKVIGLGKEILGTLASNDQLRKAGQVQQEKGTERLKAIEAQLQAEGHESKAAAADRAQYTAQRTKEMVND